MSITHLLQDFGVTASANVIVVTDVDLEEQKLTSYEVGYQAGWDDSLSSNRDAGRQVSADLVQNMRDLSMTYHEAHGALMGDLRAMLTQIVTTVLPALSQQTLAPRIVEIIEEGMRQRVHSPVLLTAAPGDCGLLSPLLKKIEGDIKVELKSDETLADGQVRLRFGQRSEQELDTQALIRGIQQAVHAFFESWHETHKEVA